MTEDNSRKKSEELAAEEESGAPVLNPLWQSGNVSTNEPGPSTEDVSHVFAEARAAALGVAAEAIRSGDKSPEGVVLPEATDVPADNDEALSNVVEAADKAKADLDDKLAAEGATLPDNEGQQEPSADTDEKKATESKKAAGDRK